MDDDLLLPAFIDDTTTLSLLQQRFARRQRFLTALLTGPTAVKNWPLKRQIPYITARFRAWCRTRRGAERRRTWCPEQGEDCW